MKLKLKHYQFISLLSGFLITLVFGSLYTLGTITPYIASYIYYEDDATIQVVDVSILYPTFTCSQVLGILFSMVYLQKKISFKFISFIGIYGLIICVIITSFVKSYFAFVFFYSALYGFIVGCSYLIPMLNCYSYLPHRKGLCSGVCMMAFGVGSLIFNQIFLKLINPDNLNPNQHHIFPQQVADNVPYAFRMISIVYFIIGTIGCLLMIPKMTLNKQIMKQEQKNSIQQGKQSLISQTSGQVLKEDNIKNEQQKITPFKQLLKTKQYKYLFFMLITSMPFSAFVAFNYKEYGQTLSKNDQLITLMGSLGAIMNSFSRIFWGWILDKWNFKHLMILLNTSQIVYMIMIIFVKNQYLYLVLILAIYFSYGGVFGIYPAQTAKIYGEKDGGRIYSIVFIGIALASVIQFLFHLIIVKKLGDSGFITCFIIFGSLLLIAQILFIKIDFKYKENISKLK